MVGTENSLWVEHWHTMCGFPCVGCHVCMCTLCVCEHECMHVCERECACVHLSVGVLIHNSHSLVRAHPHGGISGGWWTRYGLKGRSALCCCFRYLLPGWEETYCTYILVHTCMHTATANTGLILCEMCTNYVYVHYILAYLPLHKHMQI